MPEVTASKSCRDGAVSPFETVAAEARVKTSAERRGHSVLLWLNLVCLDAPLVAVSWQWLFAHAFQIAIPRGTTAALFLTAWLIYLADRFVDSLALDQRAPVSLRQRFCQRHRPAWVVAVSIIAIADLFVVWRQLDAFAVLVGGGVGGLALIYLLINQLRPSLWRALPLKEISIGLIFAAGAMVGLLRGLPAAAFAPWVLLASVCALNCVCIAVWERDLDQAQERISIATEFPRIGRLLAPMLVALSLANALLALSAPATRGISLALAVSAALLGLVQVFRNRLQPDVRTALADLVLLTPVVVLVFG